MAAAVFSFFVFLTTAFAAFTLVTGCQFYPAGEYLRFVRVPESLLVDEEVLQVEVYPRRNLTIQPVDKANDVEFFRYEAANRTVVSIRLAQSLEELVDSPLPRNVLKFRLVCDYDDGDDTITSYLSVTVYVEDVNDHSPVFQGTPYIVTVDELTPTGLTIFGGIHATDSDKPNTPNSDVQYTIAGGNEKGKFALENSPRASLILRRPLDYDSGDTKFLLTIVASDHGKEPRNATTTVQIAVTDSDDLSPKFTRDVYKTQVTEFYPITGKRIHEELLFNPRIEAYDQDRMINASIQYDIVAGNERHLFAIDQTNGTLFLERELDLDSLPGNTFTLQIQASQVDNPLKTGVARVEVELLDINDNLPQFEVDLYNISIVENLPNGFSVLQVIATDQDQGDNGEFVYHLMDPSQAFSIDGRSGWLTVRNQAKLDREQRPSLSMRVLAREKLPSVVSSPSDSYVAVEVTLLDANDNNPTFIPSNLYEFTVPTDITLGQLVGRVEAVDPDLGRNGMVLYEMKRSNNITSTNRGPQLFTVDAQSGRITVLEPPSGPGKHTLFVEASDQPANPSERRFSLAVVTIRVVETDKLEVTPDFVGAPYEFWVGSDVPIGTSVGQIRVSEAVDNKGIIYDLLHSYHEGVPFAVEERLGTITVVDDMDKYERTLYDFEAVVTDELTLTLITNVTIHVVQSDSVFQSSNLAKDLELRVRENQSGALVGQLITMDGNVTLPSSYWKMMKFVIANEPDVLEQFAISQDGTLYTQRGLDREHKDSYQLTIIAENSRALRALFRVHVIVEDENDNPPMFEGPWYSGHIREDCTPGCKVAMETGIKVHDADDGVNSQFTLTLRGNDSELFHLNKTTGAVELVGLLDRESKQEYSFKIVATDSGNLSSETSLTIYVDDINDNGPRFVQLRVHSGNMVEVENSTDSSVRVVVDNNTTMIELETSSDDLMLTTVPTIKLSETVMVGFVVVRVIAEDKDNGENATITYKMDSETKRVPQFETSSSLFSGHHFTVHPLTGDISVAAVLPPETLFQLKVSATDGGGLSQHILLKIFIKDVNNNPPLFEKSRYVFEIEEGDYMGHGVGQLIATDPDFGDNANISYSLLLKRDNSSNTFPFSITDTGVLSVDTSLDREKQSVYNFRVMAQDRGPVNRRLRSTVDVEIHVLDVNDNAPLFYGHDRVIQALVSILGEPTIKQNSDFEPTVPVPVYTASVQENNAPGITVTRVFANDSDSLANGNGMILYRIQHRSNQPHLFAVDSKEGTISTTMSLDYEVQSQHNVTIVASDLGYPSLSSTALLIVNVIDVSEQHHDTPSPVFTHRYYELEVEENCAVPLQLLTVSVSEEYRKKAMNSLQFSVARGVDSSLFDVAQHNGTVMLVSSPDREIQDKLQVVIRVQPAKQPRGFLQVIYPVQNSDLAPNEARVVIRVKDVNDNSPQFSLNGKPLVAAIPTTANYGYPIARLQASDADTGLNAEIRYQILGGEAGYFTVDALSGHIRAVASFTYYAGRVFGFDVKATDRAGAHDGRSAIANVFVYVLHENKKLALVMAAKPIDVEANIDNIIRALSNVTALDVRLRMLEPHREDGKFTDNTDMYVYAVDPVMNVIVDSDSLRDVLTAKESEVKRLLEPLHVMGVVGNGFPSSPPLRTPAHRTPLLTGLEVATIALGCVVFLGALTAAICVTCVHKKRSRFRSMGRSASVFRKKLEVGFPMSNIDIALAAKSRMDCKPRSLFHPSAFIEDSTDSYASNRSDCIHHHRRTNHRHGPMCSRHHSRRLPTRSPSTTMLEMSLASLHSSARDSGIGIGDPARIRTRCPCGHSTSHSSANSSNGSYEDSLKSLHRHSHSSGGSAGAGADGSGGAGSGNGVCSHQFATISRHQRKDSSGIAIMQPPPPPFSTPALTRRSSERIIPP